MEVKRKRENDKGDALSHLSSSFFFPPSILLSLPIHLSDRHDGLMASVALYQDKLVR